MEKDYNQFKEENDILKKENELMKNQLSTLKNNSNNNNSPKTFIVSIAKCESFEILGSQEEEEFEEIYIDNNGNMPPQFLQNKNIGEEYNDEAGVEGEEEEEQELTDEQKLMLLQQMKMQQMQGQNGDDEEEYIIGQGDNEEMENVEYEEI